MNYQKKILYLPVWVPSYITPVIADRIATMMEEGKIHPRHHVCDMTIEVAAGASLKEALQEMVRRNERNDTASIYQKLFPQW